MNSARIESKNIIPSRGFSTPQIDMAADTNRQIVVDREKGQYLGHPTTVLLDDKKTILIVYPKGHGGGEIIMKRSDDGGKTWSKRLPVPANWSTSKEVPTLYPIVDTNGIQRLVMFSGLYPIRMASSDDQGKTWTPLNPIGDFGGIVAMGDVMRLKDGTHMACFHDDGRFISKDPKILKERGKYMYVYKTISKDTGRTWSAPEIVTTRKDAGLCEPGMIRSLDGSQIAMLLRENYRKHNSMVVFSNDEGKTWTKPRELPGALTGDRHTLRYAPDGRIVATFRDTGLESPTKGDWVGWVGTYDDIVAGREGQYRMRFMDNHHAWDCAYPGLELLPDGTFAATTYGHWKKGEKPYIVCVRFSLAETDRKAKNIINSIKED